MADIDQLTAERDFAVANHKALLLERAELAKDWWKVQAYNTVLAENNALVAILSKIAQESPTSLSEATKASLGIALQKPRCAAFLSEWQANSSRLMELERLVSEFVTELATCETPKEAAEAAARFQGSLEQKGGFSRVDVFDHINPAAEAMRQMFVESGEMNKPRSRDQIVTDFCADAHCGPSMLWLAVDGGKLDELCPRADEMSAAGIAPATNLEMALGRIAYSALAHMMILGVDPADALRRVHALAAVSSASKEIE